MPPNEKVRIGDQDYDLERVQITASQEAWNTYLLEDGSSVRLKVVVQRICRANGAFDPEGNPIYFVKSINVLDVDGGDSVRKKPEDS